MKKLIFFLHRLIAIKTHDPYFLCRSDARAAGRTDIFACARALDCLPLKDRHSKDKMKIGVLREKVVNKFFCSVRQRSIRPTDCG